MGAQMVREGRLERTSDIAGDGTTTATVLASAIVKEGAKAVAAGHEPDGPQSAGIDPRSRGDRRRSAEELQEGHFERGRIAPGSAPSPPTATPRSARFLSEAMKKVGNEGRDHRRGGEVARDRARRGRRHAVRPRLYLALLHHQRRQDARSRWRIPTSSSTRRSSPACRSCCPCSRPWCRPAKAAPDRRRGRRGRGARHPRGQQAARRPQGRCPSRPPGLPATARKAMLQDIAILNRAAKRSPRTSASSLRNVTINMLGRRQEGDDSTRENTTIVNGAGKEGRHRGPHQPDQGAESRRPPRTTTVRSCRSALPSSRAASSR